MRRGEIRWYRFAAPDKKRPVLILTWDSAIEYLGELTVAPVTSRSRGISSEVPLSRAEGLARDSVVNLDHVQCVPKGEIGPLITSLPPERWSEVGEALRYALGF